MNAFDRIATKSADKKSSSTTKKQASTTETVQKTVDELIANKAQMAKLTQAISDNESIIIGHVMPQYENLARKGEFTKSLEVMGKKGRLLFVTSDSFSVPQDEDSLNALQELLGDLFDNFFEKKRAISIKETALKDEKILNKVAAACTKAGLNIADIFEVGDKVVAKDDLDRKQFEVPEEKYPTFKALVHQKKPALK